MEHAVTRGHAIAYSADSQLMRAAERPLVVGLGGAEPCVAQKEGRSHHLMAMPVLSGRCVRREVPGVLKTFSLSAVSLLPVHMLRIVSAGIQ